MPESSCKWLKSWKSSELADKCHQPYIRNPQWGKLKKGLLPEKQNKHRLWELREGKKDRECELRHAVQGNGLEFRLWSVVSFLNYCHSSRVHLCETLWTAAREAPLSTGFSRQEHWSELPCPPPGDLLDPGIKPTFVPSPALADGFFTTSKPSPKNLKKHAGDKEVLWKIWEWDLDSSQWWIYLFWNLCDGLSCYKQNQMIEKDITYPQKGNSPGNRLWTMWLKLNSQGPVQWSYRQSIHSGFGNLGYRAPASRVPRKIFPQSYNETQVPYHGTARNQWLDFHSPLQAPFLFSKLQPLWISECSSNALNLLQPQRPATSSFLSASLAHVFWNRLTSLNTPCKRISITPAQTLSCLPLAFLFFRALTNIWN